MSLKPYAPETPTPEAARALSGLTVLEFGTHWCGICKGAQLLIKHAMAGAAASVHHIKVEDGPGQPLGRSLKVKLWPTLIALKNGQEVERVVRPTDGESIARVLHALR